MSRRSTETTGSDLAICAALFAVAAAVRLLFLMGTVDRALPFSIFYYGDSRIYREFALAILRGDLFDQGVPLHPPAFAYLLSWIIGAVGERPTAVRVILAILGAAAVPLTYLLGRRLWGRAVGVLGALLATFSFGLCVLAVSANAETIYLPLLAAQALLLVMLGDALGATTEEGRRTDALLTVASGVVLGLGALTRAEHLGLAVVLPAALVIGWPAIPRRTIVLRGAVAAGIALLVITPWTIRNHRTLTRFNADPVGPAIPVPTFAPVTGTGGLVFVLANNAGADGTFRPESVLTTMGLGKLDFRDPAQVDLYVNGFRRGWSFLLGDPGAWAKLWYRKIALASDAHALGFGLSNWPGGLRGTRRPVDVFTPESEIWKPACWILLAAGLWFSRSMLRRGAILLLLPLFGIAVTLAAFGYARFFLQAMPFVCLFQAAGIVALTGRLRTRAARRVVAGLGAVLAVLLTVELVAASFQPLNFRATGSLDPATGKILQDATVELEPSGGAR